MSSYIDEALKQKALSDLTQLVSVDISDHPTTGGVSGRMLMQGLQHSKTTIAACRPTVVDRIEERMCNLQNQMDRLKSIKKQLSEPNGVLSMPMDDLYFLLHS